MSWLRIDDTFGDHPKLLLLTRSERWTFVELLCYCARHQTEGYFPVTISDSKRHVSTTLLNKFVDVGLVDESEESGELRIHDWQDFNPSKDPTGAIRQQRWRNARSNAPRNGRVTENVTGDVTPSRARDPVPSPTPEPEGSHVSEKTTTKTPSYETQPPGHDDDPSHTNKTNHLTPTPERDLQGLEHLFQPGILAAKEPK